MSDSNKDIQVLIDKYLLGNITKTELDMLQTKSSSNPELADQLQQDLEIVSGIQSHGNQQLKERLKAIHKEVIVDAPQKAKIRRLGITQIAVAASVILLLAAGLWFFLSPQASTDIYATYYQPHSNISLTTRGDENSLADAETFYLNKQYAAALPIFEKTLVQPNIPNADQIRLAAGICEMELGNFGNAIEYFELIIQNEAPLQIDHAIWYSALSFVKLGDKARAITMLGVLAKDAERDHHQQAKNVLTDLE